VPKSSGKAIFSWARAEKVIKNNIFFIKPPTEGNRR
jgi:hypothetical protein